MLPDFGADKREHCNISAPGMNKQGPESTSREKRSVPLNDTYRWIYHWKDIISNYVIIRVEDTLKDAKQHVFLIGLPLHISQTGFVPCPSTCTSTHRSTYRICLSVWLPVGT